MASEKRLIDANEVERKLRIAISSWQCDCNSNAPVIARAMEDALQRVIYAPTVDAVEVVHARWENGHCTNCKQKAEVQSIGFNCTGGTRVNYKETNYCPHCGAKMDGEEA